jgi:Ca2+-transporting ATPase
MLLASVPLHQAKGLGNLLKTNLEKGVQGDDTDLVKRRDAFGSNIYPRKKGRSFWVKSITNLIF